MSHALLEELRNSVERLRNEVRRTNLDRGLAVEVDLARCRAKLNEVSDELALREAENRALKLQNWHLRDQLKETLL